MKNLFFTNQPVLNQVLTCVDDAGRAEWRPSQGASIPEPDLWQYIQEPDSTWTLVPNPAATTAVSPSHIIAPLPGQTLETFVNQGWFFDVTKHAFRAGRATAGQWVDANRGIGSVGIGDDCLVNGADSIALGGPTLSVVGASNSLVTGTANSVLDVTGTPTTDQCSIWGGTLCQVQAVTTNPSAFVASSQRCSLINCQSSYIRCSVGCCLMNTLDSSVVNSHQVGPNTVLSGSNVQMLGAGDSSTMRENTLVNGRQYQLIAPALLRYTTVLNGSNSAISGSRNNTVLNGTGIIVRFSSSNNLVGGDQSFVTDGSSFNVMFGDQHVFGATNFTAFNSFACGSKSTQYSANSFTFGDGSATVNLGGIAASKTFNVMATNGVLMQTRNLLVSPPASLFSTPFGPLVAGFFSTNQGMVMPVIANVTTDIATPLPGMVVFDNATNRLVCWNGVGWQPLW